MEGEAPVLCECECATQPVTMSAESMPPEGENPTPTQPLVGAYEDYTRARQPKLQDRRKTTNKQQ